MKDFEGVGYIAWIDNPKNFKMLVHGSSPEEAAKELLTSLKVAISYKLGINIQDLYHKEFTSEEALEKEISASFKKTGSKEIKLALS